MSNVAYQMRDTAREERHIKKSSTVVVEKGRITKGEVILLSLLAAAIFIASLFVLSNYSTIQSLNRDVHALQTEIDKHVSANEDLQLQVTELSEPDRILLIAKEKLGLSLNEKNVKVITD